MAGGLKPVLRKLKPVVKLCVRWDPGAESLGGVP